MSKTGKIVCSQSGEVPTCVIQNLTYSVLSGTSVTLQCIIYSDPVATAVQWIKTSNGQTQNISPNPKGKYIGATVGSPSLVISITDTTDEGNYTCTATNSIGTGRSQQALLIVLGELPTCVIQHLTYSVLSGNSVTLQCIIYSDPVATAVQWTKTSNGQTQNISPKPESKYIGAIVGSPSLVISNTDTTDNGYYTCTATNSIGTGRSQQAFLIVLEGQEKFNIYNISAIVALGICCLLGIPGGIVLCCKTRKNNAAMQKKVAYLMINKGRPSLTFESYNLLQRLLPLTQSDLDLEKKYCVISFSPNNHERNRALIRTAVGETLTEVHFLITRTKGILSIPKVKIIFVCIEYNPSNVILETPGQDEDDLKLLTVQACRKIRADVFVIYIGDEGSRDLGTGLMYNSHLKTVTEHFELKQLYPKRRVLSVDTEFSMSQEIEIANAIGQI